MPTMRSPVSPRARACPYSEYVTQQQRALTCQANKDLHDGPQLWRQMMAGFTCAGFVGLAMLVLGTVFIAEAVTQQQPITVMLCVMGIVFGIIIVVGTFLLGKVLISRKWIRCQGREIPPAAQCFHTCSVVYSPSLDQLGASESMLEPPPSYDSVNPLTNPETLGTSSQVTNGVEVVIVLPPKYIEVSKPIPEYCEEEVLASDDVPPYKEIECEDNC